MSDEDSNYSSPSNESLSHRSKRPKSKFEEFFEIIHASQTDFCKLCQHKKIEIKMKNRNTSGLNVYYVVKCLLRNSYFHGKRHIGQLIFRISFQIFSYLLICLIFTMAMLIQVHNVPILIRFSKI
ncbi:hypothetical protein WA026_022491 [Henosepilachna vigintioctopunctata]|uniref:Uncharacterized protein n=1 Tax=Henosepilachna vigintioctopunctata TaxID=420089 RepID=A0AAW1TZW0_9CUCU